MEGLELQGFRLLTLFDFGGARVHPSIKAIYGIPLALLFLGICWEFSGAPAPPSIVIGVVTFP